TGQRKWLWKVEANNDEGPRFDCRAVFSPDSTRVWTSDNGAVCLWDVAKGAPLFHEHSRNGPDYPCTSAFSRDSKLVAVSDLTGVITIWDARTGARLSSLSNHEGETGDPLAFTPDAKGMAIAQPGGQTS